MLWPFKRSKPSEKDLEDEIAFDLAAEAEERIQAGISPDEAAFASRRDLGNVTRIKENLRSTRQNVFLARLGQDIHYGWRTLRKSRLFTALAVVSLALGIGSATAIYSVMDAILFRALPVRDPSELVILNWRALKPTGGFTEPSGIRAVDGSVSIGPAGERVSADFPWPFYLALREANDVFSNVFAYKYVGELTVTVEGQAELGDVQFASGNFFSSLGVNPAAGRLIQESDERPDAPPVVVLSYDYWRDRFGADAGAIGRTIRIGKVPFTICGVVAPEFFGLVPGSSTDFYIPMQTRPTVVADSGLGEPGQQMSLLADPHFYWADIIGRLRPGVTMAQAEATVATQFRQFLIGAGADVKRADMPSLWLSRGGSGLDSLRSRYSKPLFVLMCMVMLILAIACANIANLLLARAAVRRREMAVRLSLGASRARVIRQLLTESLLLALPGGILGLGVAAAGIRFLLWLLSGGSADVQVRATLDWPVLAFTFAAAVGTAILFGLAPALQATRVDIAPTLKGTSASVRAGGATGFKRILVIAQIALSCLLVVGAVIFVRTLANLHSVQLGFNAENVLTFNLNASKAGYKGATLNAFYNRIEARIRTLPGVRDVGAAGAPSGTRSYRTPVQLPEGKKGWAGWNSVGQSFFETMQIPVVLGRALNSHDVKGAAPVAVVNELFAKTHFAKRSPIGERIGILDGGQEVTIVGVVANSRESLKERFAPFVYISYNQFPAPEWRGMFFQVRTAIDPIALATSVQKAIREVAPDVPVANMMTQTERIERSLTRERTLGHLCTAFAVLALTIACIGLYGSMAYAVSSRTSEIGIRMALGAQRSNVMWMVMREVFALTAAGLVLGFLCARTALPVVQSFLFGVKLGDAGVIAWAVGLMIVSTLIAGFAPARRASQVNPIQALRHE